jgi:hypothetical protein
VIPQVVQETYQSLINNKGEFYSLKNVSHLLLFPQNDEEENARNYLYSAIL